VWDVCVCMCQTTFIFSPLELSLSSPACGIVVNVAVW
jgi:hypothetical protein